MSDKAPAGAFWSGETLQEKLPALIQPFNPDNIDCAAYELTIGHEVYVSPSDETPQPKSRTKVQLSDLGGFTIPPGQFAFLLTEEEVRVPHDALAFLSMKAQIKFKGLVNVSGFHVDPGWNGQLIFSVFNAGPQPVHLEQGQRAFLIWYANLDGPSKFVKDEPTHRGINPNQITGISGEVLSLEGLGSRLHIIEREQAVVRAIGLAVLAAVVGAVLTYIVRGAPGPTTQASYQPSSPASTTVGPATAQPPTPLSSSSRAP